MTAPPPDIYACIGDAAIRSLTTPEKITHVSIVASDRELTLTWTEPRHRDPILHYVLEYKRGDQPNSQRTTYGNLNTLSITLYSLVFAGVDTPLVNGTEYDFWVTAVNGYGAGPSSDMAAGVPGIEPAQVSAATLFPIDGGNTLTDISGVGFQWVPPANNGYAITQYIIRYAPSTSPTAFAYYTFNAPVPPANTLPTVRFNGLLPGVVYLFSMAAINAQGTGAYSSPEIALECGVVHNEAILLHDIVSGNAQFTISWG